MSDRAKYWERLVAAWEKSGLSQAEFCRRRGVKVSAFAWWKRQLRGRTKKVRRRGRRDMGGPKSRRRAGFAEVALPKAMLNVASRGMSTFEVGSSGYEIVLLSGRLIRLPQGFDPSVVAPLITAVESC